MGTIGCRIITKIYGARNNTVTRCPVAVQNNMYMEDFVYEANLKLGRLTRLSHTTEYNGLDRDMNGGRVLLEIWCIF